MEQSIRGRPSGYEPEYATQAEKLCKLGATDRDLADFFEVSIRTIERWRVQHEDFCRAVKNGKDEADDRVERSLYNRAVGYTFESEKIFNYQGSITRAPCLEHVPPDTTAQIFWLKNRRKDEWKDRSSQEINRTNLNIDVAFEDYIRSLTGATEPKVINGTVAAEGTDLAQLAVPLRAGSHLSND